MGCSCFLISSFLPFLSLLSFLLLFFLNQRVIPFQPPIHWQITRLYLADISPAASPCPSSPQLSPHISRRSTVYSHAWECGFHSSSLSCPWMGTRFLFQNRSSHSNLTLWLPTALKITSRLPSVAFHSISQFRQHAPFSAEAFWGHFREVEPLTRCSHMLIQGLLVLAFWAFGEGGSVLGEVHCGWPLFTRCCKQPPPTIVYISDESQYHWGHLSSLLEPGSGGVGRGDRQTDNEYIK